jgi:putative hemolysin
MWKPGWSLCAPLFAALVLAACVVPPGSPPAHPTEAPAQLANPASENCVAQGGTLLIETRGDGGQYGVCLFEDNRQCEEWALYRGDCPVGGLKVTGYVTPAAQYCAITGGTYAIIGASNTDTEQGTCTFKDGSSCDVWAYYNGACGPASTGEAESADETDILVGSYTGQMPAADAIGRVILLVLMPDGTATLTTQFIGEGEPMVETGVWEGTADHASVSIPASPTLEFEYEDGTLVLQDPMQSGYGTGLTLTKTPSGIRLTAEYGGVTFQFDEQLARSAEGETLAAIPPAEGPALGGASPAAVRFLFDEALVQDYFDPRVPQLLVYKTDDWIQLDPSTATTVAELQSLLSTRPASISGSIPLLPPIPAAQILHAQTRYVDFQDGSGVGFLTAYAQDASPITNSQLFYTFQGLTHDAKYYVAVYFPVTTPLLPNEVSFTGDAYTEWVKDYDAYLATVTTQLDDLLSAGFSPDLALLLGLVDSIRIADSVLE